MNSHMMYQFMYNTVWSAAQINNVTWISVWDEFTDVELFTPDSTSGLNQTRLLYNISSFIVK